MVDLPPPLPAIVAPLSAYPGCPVPAAPHGTTWTVDPVNGNDASPNGPWKTLQTVLSTKIAGSYYKTPFFNSAPQYAPLTLANGGATIAGKNGPIQPGDTIQLLPGDHGAIKLTSGLNSDFIYVEGGPGVVIDHMEMTGVSHWVWQGIQFGPTPSPVGNYVVAVFGNNYQGPADNIIFDSDIIAGPANVVGWTQAQWQASVPQGLELINAGNEQLTHCNTVTNTQIWHVLTGAFIESVDVLFQGNTINQFGEDGVDYGGVNERIYSNTVENSNSVYPGTSLHVDCMQGQGWEGVASNGVNRSGMNIMIEDNKCLRRTGAESNYFDGPMQGIDTFDYDWTNVLVRDNLIRTRACQGIAFYSTHNGSIDHNVVIDDGDQAVQPGCSPDVNAQFKASESTFPSSDMVVNYNIAPAVHCGSAAQTQANCAYNFAAYLEYIRSDGTAQYTKTPGVYGTNVLDLNPFGLFTSLN